MDIIPICELPRLPRRAPDGHKGTYGTVQVVAGSRGMAGAAVLAGRAALRSGAGLVRVACPAEIQDVVALGHACYMTKGIRQHTDGTFAAGAAQELGERASEADAVAVGPGLGRSPDVSAFMRELLGRLHNVPVVLDADGLFAVSPFTTEFGKRETPLVLTPHPGEFARLTGESLPKGEAERQRQATTFANKVRVVVLLKGANTLVTDGTRLYRNTTGNPGMATGGSGDVLTGVITALIGQGLSGFDAAVLGAWVHGRAGDLAAAVIGQTALAATDIIEYLPGAFRELESGW